MRAWCGRCTSSCNRTATSTLSVFSLRFPPFSSSSSSIAFSQLVLSLSLSHEGRSFVIIVPDVLVHAQSALQNKQTPYVPLVLLCFVFIVVASGGLRRMRHDRTEVGMQMGPQIGMLCTAKGGGQSASCRDKRLETGSICPCPRSPHFRRQLEAQICGGRERTVMQLQRARNANRVGGRKSCSRHSTMTTELPNFSPTDAEWPTRTRDCM